MHAVLACDVNPVLASSMRYRIPSGLRQSCIACLGKPLAEDRQICLESATSYPDQKRTVCIQTRVSLACPTFASEQHGQCVAVKSPVPRHAACLCCWTGPEIR